MSERNYRASEVPGEAYKNAKKGARSAHDAAVKGYLAGVDPVVAAAKLGVQMPGQMAELAGGGLIHLMTPDVQAMLAQYPHLKQALDTSGAFGAEKAHQYGGWENIKRTAAEHPYQMAADASMLLPGMGAAGVARNAMAKGATRAQQAIHFPPGHVPLTVHTKLHSRLADGPPPMVNQPVFPGARGGPDPLMQRPNYRTGKGPDLIDRTNHPIRPQTGDEYVQDLLVDYDNARRLGYDMNADDIRRHINDIIHSEYTRINHPSSRRAAVRARNYINRIEDPQPRYVSAYYNHRGEPTGAIAFTNPNGGFGNLLFKPKKPTPRDLAPTLTPRNAMAQDPGLAPEFGGRMITDTVKRLPDGTIVMVRPRSQQ